jgi:T5SS/PEP-CTERM-associated repeat protein
MTHRTRWIGREGNFNWFDPARWTNGVPQANSRVYFDNGGTQTVRLGNRAAEAGRLEVGRDTLTLSKGVLDLTGGPAQPDMQVYDEASLTVAAGGAVITGGAVAVGVPNSDYGYSTGALTVAGYLSAGSVDDVSGTVTVAAGAALNVSGGFSLTPFEFLPNITQFGSLSVQGVVTTGTISGLGTITEMGPGADLTAAALTLYNGTLTVAGGGIAAMGAVQLGNPEIGVFATINVTGAGSSVTTGEIVVLSDSNGSLSVADGGTLTASAILTNNSESDGIITVSGAGSSLDVGTLSMGNIEDSDMLSVTQGGSLITGAGGLTIDVNALQLDATATISTPLLTSLAGTIDAVAGGGSVTLSSAIALGLDPETQRGVTTFTAGTGAALTVTGAITGQAGSSLVTAGDIVLANAANALPGIGIENGTLEIATNGAAGMGTISFLGSSTPTTLQIDPTVTLTNTIAGFTGSDAIDLQGFAFNANIMESLQNGTLTLNNGTQTANVVFAGSYAADQFVLQADVHGGTLITFQPQTRV